MSDAPQNPAYRNKHAERWREIARCLRVALSEAVAQLQQNSIDPSWRIKEALIKGHAAFGKPPSTSAYGIRPVPLHTCEYDATDLCRICDMPKP